MDRSGAMRKAQTAARIADDVLASEHERDAARRRIEQLARRFHLSEAEIRPPPADVLGGVDFELVGRWSDPTMMKLLGIVLGAAGGRLLGPDQAGNAWVAASRVALPRLRDLAERLFHLYRSQGEKIDQRASEMRSFAFGMDLTYSIWWGQQPALPDKTSFWVGLTIGLLQRLIPPPPPNTSSTSLVIANPFSRAARGATEQPFSAAPQPVDSDGEATEMDDFFEVKSQADFLAGQRAAESVLLGDRARALAAIVRSFQFSSTAQHRR